MKTVEQQFPDLPKGKALSTIKMKLAMGNNQGVYLFEGRSGYGHAEAAKLFVRYAQCLGSQTITCDCQACKSFPDSPDVLIVGDKEGSIKVDDMEDVGSHLKTRSQVGVRSLLVLGSHRMTPASWPSLLRIMEDGGDRLIVITIDEDHGSVSDTIRSRCSIVRFQPPVPVGRTAALGAALYKSIGLAAKNESEYERAFALSKSIMQKIAKGKTGEAIQDVLSFGSNLLPFIDMWYVYLCDLQLAQLGNAESITLRSELEGYRKTADKFSDEAIISTINAVRVMRSDMVKVDTKFSATQSLCTCFYVLDAMVKRDLKKAEAKK